MEIISEILRDPERKARLAQLINNAVACKHRITQQKEYIESLRKTAMHDMGLNPKDFNAEVRKYWKR